MRVGSCSVEVAGQARDEEWAVCVLTGLRAYEVGFNTNENEENYICGFDDGGDGGVYSPWPPLRGGRATAHDLTPALSWRRGSGHTDAGEHR